MIVPAAVPDVRLDSILGRTSPLTKLAVAVAWLIGLAFTTQPWPPVAIATVALVAGIVLGRIPAGTIVRAVAPLWIVALVVAVSNTVFGAANPDPAATEILRLGPLRLTEQALATGVALGLRVVAIASVGAVFALTTDSTRLVDALVQQARVPERFAYGALAAYQAVPHFAEDLATLRDRKRIRGLRGTWHPRLLLGLLVLAIRHGDRMALAMDARAFGSGPRSRSREVHWSALDLGVAIGSTVALAGALALAVAR
jgi:ABC-type cobalt transport system, permease component CbiQ and related transporters